MQDVVIPPSYGLTIKADAEVSGGLRLSQQPPDPEETQFIWLSHHECQQLLEALHRWLDETPSVDDEGVS